VNGSSCDLEGEKSVAHCSPPAKGLALAHESVFSVTVTAGHGSDVNVSLPAHGFPLDTAAAAHGLAVFITGSAVVVDFQGSAVWGPGAGSLL